MKEDIDSNEIGRALFDKGMDAKGALVHHIYNFLNREDEQGLLVERKRNGDNFVHVTIAGIERINELLEDEGL